MAICGGTFDWRGETVAILGTGPSLTQSRAQACRDRCKVVVAINRATDLAPWADWAFFSQYHEMIASSFSGLRTAMNGRGPLPDNAYFVDLWSGGPLLARSDDRIRAGRNAAWAAPCRCGSKQLDCRLLAGRWAIDAVARTGAARILLLGFDGVTVAGAHFYESTPAKPAEHDKLYLAQCWPDCARMARERGVEVINCSPGTMMAAFPCAWLGEAL